MKKIELSSAEICTLICATTVELEKRQKTLEYLKDRECILHSQDLIHRTKSRIAELESIITKLEGCLYE